MFEVIDGLTAAKTAQADQPHVMNFESLAEVCCTAGMDYATAGDARMQAMLDTFQATGQVAHFAVTTPPFFILTDIEWLIRKLVVD